MLNNCGVHWANGFFAPTLRFNNRHVPFSSATGGLARKRGEVDFSLASTTNLFEQQPQQTNTTANSNEFSTLKQQSPPFFAHYPSLGDNKYKSSVTTGESNITSATTLDNHVLPKSNNDNVIENFFKTQFRPQKSFQLFSTNKATAQGTADDEEFDILDPTASDVDVDHDIDDNSYDEAEGIASDYEDINPYWHHVQKKRKNPSPTAPEVNKWTDIMFQDSLHLQSHDRSYKSKEVPPSKHEMTALYEGLLSLTGEDLINIESYWDKLMPKISYLGSQSASRVKEALRVAYFSHRHQNRKSGEPFIIHPVEVALLLSDLKMDSETIIAGLLHDTVEDTDLTFGQVETLFGHTVRNIVEGETKVSKLPKLAFSDYADEQAENLRQMFVAMTDDYRIIIVKLADRLHNMRTLNFMKPEKQKKISRETLDIFAPLAHRMGIWQFKSELEDTAFMYLYPEEYKKLNRRLRRHQTRYRDTLDTSKAILQETLATDPTLKEQKVKFEVYGRTKELYSLWHKMETKKLENLDQITDVVALRVILYPLERDDESTVGTDRGVWLCYHVLGLVQHLPGFQPVPTRVKDYISFPKPNGYQSLHTALMLNGQTVEVQIRTGAMHQVAEYGMASHWAYTGKKRGMDDELYNTPWLSTIKEWQNDVTCSRDFVESVRKELLGKRVFVFLRNGKILNLARGATVIDAAFSIHTEVGLHMYGAHINGRPAPLSYELRNGDVVSIHTGEGKPTTDWMRFAKSRSTRAKLRSYFRAKQRESLQEAGGILLHDFLNVHEKLIAELSFLDQSPPKTLEEFEALLPGNGRYDNLDDLLMEIGKRHDRQFLRSIVSKVLKVPLSSLDEAERKNGYKARLLSENIFAAVRASRKKAKDAGSVINPEATESTLDPTASNLTVTNTAKTTTETSGASAYSASPVLFADAELLCEDCLPVKGDDIIGTKAIDPSRPSEDSSSPIIVHRTACIHAQRAMNRSQSLGRVLSDNQGGSVTFSNVPGEKAFARRVDTVEDLRFKRNQIAKTVDASVVNLVWANLKDEEDITYMAEVEVVANDRKLLLADCSEIVSEIAFIVKTGSATSNEHASLDFLVKVQNLKHLQHLMDALRSVPSVMSVERKFGSELL